MSTKTAIILTATMAILSYVHDTVRVGVSIRPAPACHEAVAPAAAVNLASGIVTVRVPADGGTLELRVGRAS